MSIPFLAGAHTHAQRQAKVSKLLYGRRKMMLNEEAAEKPSLSSLLIHASRNEVASVMKPAHMSGELTPEMISEALRRLKPFGRYDKALSIARAYELVSEKKLRASHFTLLMSIALSSSSSLSSSSHDGGWREALRIFNSGIVRRGHPLTSASVGTVFAALKQGNQWQRSTAFFDQVVEDRVPLESKAVHTLVSHLRRSKQWELALSTFDRAVSPPASVKPDYLLYRELLLTVRDSAQRGVPGAWAFALSIASAIDSVCPPNAGIYNCLIETCATLPSSSSSSQSTRRERRWEAGLAVFQHMQERTLLSALQDNSTRTIVNAGTISALSGLMPNNADHQIRCHGIARKHGLPVSAEVYRRLFSSLDLAGRTSEAVAFVEKQVDDAITDPTNSGLALQPMLLGLADSLACHPSPLREAVPVAEFLRATLQPAISPATAGCAAWGDAAQSWVLEARCRVAVVDTAVLLSPSFDDLLLPPAFDAIMIPFTSVRALLRKIDSEPAHSPAAEAAKRAIRRIRHMQQSLAAPTVTRRDGTVEQAGAGPLQVMSFAHHLRALQFVAEEFEGIADEETAAERMNALLSLAESDVQQRDQQQSSGSAKGFRVLEEEKEAPKKRQQKDDEAAAVVVSSSRRRHRGAGIGKKPVSTLTVSHPAAVALMLSRLNPDAEVTAVCGHAVTESFCRQAGVKCVPFRELVAKSRLQQKVKSGGSSSRDKSSSSSSSSSGKATARARGSRSEALSRIPMSSSQMDQDDQDVDENGMEDEEETVERWHRPEKKSLRPRLRNRVEEDSSLFMPS